MLFNYAPAVSKAQRDAVFLRMQAEGLLGCAMSALAAPTLADWRRITSPRRGLLLCCHLAEGGDSWGKSGPAARSGDGLTVSPDPGTTSMLGCALFTPRRGKVWEFDFTTFRTAARLAVRMALGGLAWAFAHLDCAAIAGLCPAPNRHAWRLAEACGFHVMGRLPQACWHARKQCHVDGVLVLCTPRDLAEHTTAREAVMGFGGGYSSPSVPEVTPAPKPEVQKPVTEAATAARQAQKDKASKAAGINASVYTSPLNRADATQKTLLGQ